MRKFLSVILIFFLSLSALAFDSDNFFNRLNSLGSVTDTYEYICQSNNSNEGPISQTNYQNICHIVRDNEVCKDVPEEEKLACKDIEENSLDMSLFSSVFDWDCWRGIWQSAVNFFEFIVGMIKGSLGYVFDSDYRDEKNEALGEYYDSFMNYLAIEFDKAREETDSDYDATLLVAKDIAEKGMNAITEMIKETYFTLGCYNQSARQARVCEIVGEMIMPPIAAVALVFKSAKVVKKLKTVVENRSKDHGVIKDEDLVVKKEPRELSEEEVKGSNIRAISNKLEEIMSDEGRDFIAAPQIGQGLQLIGVRRLDKKITTMANPKIQSDDGSTALVHYIDVNTGELKTAKFADSERTNILSGLDRLNGRRFDFQDDKVYESLGLSASKGLSIEDRKLLGEMVNKLSPKDKKSLAPYASTLNKDIADIKNPRSLVSSLGDDALKDILNLYSNTVKASSSAEKFKKFDQWVKSDAHALYLYDSLLMDGVEKNSDALRYLMAKNKYFSRVRPIRGSPKNLVTYSFEKESNIDDITLWYKTTGVSDEDWFKLTSEERLEQIKKATNVMKKSVAEDRITGTEFKPKYVGGYSQELGLDSKDKSYTWEIANKKYEISLDRTLGQVDEVAKFTGERHSFHTHVVFDMPNDYKDFNKFALWTKRANDFIYLKGMEEGLHGNFLTGVAHLVSEAPERVKSTVGNTVPTSLSSISLQSHKFFSMGIRGDIYGKSPIDNHKKVGLELRDSSRKPDVLKAHLNKVADTTQDFGWEKLPSDMPVEDFARIRVSDEILRNDLKDVVTDPFLKRLEKDVPNAAIALNRFEEYKYFDYKKGKVKELSDSEKERVVKAREYFIEEMKKIDRNVIDMKKKGESFEKEDVEMAVQMTLSEWAKMARVSELFDGI